MHQSYPPQKSAAASVTAGEDVVLQSVDKFCYLGSYMSNIVTVDSDITSRLAKAGSAFGKLQRRLWNVHDVSKETKIAVYHAVVLTTLLYGCETWTLYRHSVRKLDQFHLRCLRKIAGIQWQEIKHESQNTDAQGTRAPTTTLYVLCGLQKGIRLYLP